MSKELKRKIDQAPEEDPVNSNANMNPALKILALVKQHLGLKPELMKPPLLLIWCFKIWPITPMMTYTNLGIIMLMGSQWSLGKLLDHPALKIKKTKLLQIYCFKILPITTGIPYPYWNPGHHYHALAKAGEPREPKQRQKLEQYKNYMIPKLKENGELCDHDAIEWTEVNKPKPNPNPGHNQRKNDTCPVDPDCNRTTGFVDQELSEMHITFDHPEYALKTQK